MKKRFSELTILAGCGGCGKDCNWRALTADKARTQSSTAKYGCNTSKEVKE